jgi:hypothetical protein
VHVPAGRGLGSRRGRGWKRSPGSRRSLRPGLARRQGCTSPVGSRRGRRAGRRPAGKQARQPAWQGPGPHRSGVYRWSVSSAVSSDLGRPPLRAGGRAGRGLQRLGERRVAREGRCAPRWRDGVAEGWGASRRKSVGGSCSREARGTEGPDTASIGAGLLPALRGWAPPARGHQRRPQQLGQRHRGIRQLRRQRGRLLVLLCYCLVGWWLVGWLVDELVG